MRLHIQFGAKNYGFKVKAIKKIPTQLAVGVITITKELIKINKDVFMKAEILFVNVIPFFISLIHNTTFTTVRNIEYRKSITIFKAFNEIHMYYLKYIFQITNLHVDGEFAPLQALIK